MKSNYEPIFKEFLENNEAEDSARIGITTYISLDDVDMLLKRQKSELEELLITKSAYVVTYNDNYGVPIFCGCFSSEILAKQHIELHEKLSNDYTVKIIEIEF